MIDDELDETLLDRYRTGECTSDERARVERWLRDDPSRAAELEWIDTLDLAAPRLGGAWDTDTLWRTFQARVGGGAGLPPVNDARMVAPATLPRRSGRAWADESVARVTSPRWRSYALRAAGLLVVVTGATLLWRRNPVSTIGDASARATQPATRTYRTEPGQRLSIQLADGSQVTLAAQTQLTVPASLDGGNRDVSLDGQAYFEIAHRTGAPFRVHTADAVTTVLGTRFVIDAYHDDRASVVTVADGRVSVAPISHGPSTRPAPVTLSAGDRARLDTARGIAIEHDVDLVRALAWTEGRLEFTNVPLRDVVPQLNRWFDLDIHLATPTLDNRRLTASFKSESASEMLQVITASLDLRMRRTGRSVVLSPRS